MHVIGSYRLVIGSRWGKLKAGPLPGPGGCRRPAGRAPPLRASTGPGALTLFVSFARLDTPAWRGALGDGLGTAAELHALGGRAEAARPAARPRNRAAVPPRRATRPRAFS